jgi:prepilin-type processing-associated H-X9-DG protein
MFIATIARLRHSRGVIPAPAAICLRRSNTVLASRVEAGFSLVELLIVAALLFILTTLYLGNGARGYQAQKMVECGKNLQNIYVALKTYALDNHDRLPILAGAETSEPVLSQLIPRYTTGTEFFICPGSKDSPLPDATPFADRRISYAYYMGHNINDGAAQPLLSDRQVNTAAKTVGQLLFSANGKKPGNNHNKYGGNIQFCDGSVQTSPPASAFNLTNTPGVTLLNPKP